MAVPDAIREHQEDATAVTNDGYGCVEEEEEEGEEDEEEEEEEDEVIDVKDEEDQDEKGVKHEDSSSSSSGPPIPWAPPHKQTAKPKDKHEDKEAREMRFRLIQLAPSQRNDVRLLVDISKREMAKPKDQHKEDSAKPKDDQEGDSAASAEEKMKVKKWPDELVQFTRAGRRQVWKLNQKQGRMMWCNQSSSRGARKKRRGGRAKSKKTSCHRWP